MTTETTKRTILIIDDEPDLRTYLATLFEDNGFEALTTGDGNKGLELARRREPDLICLDISMPAPSGVRVYRELKGDPKLASIPVVMVTGVPRQFEEFISRRRQVPPPEGYVAKPFDPEQLLAKVQEILK
jgi:two-component system phosphate regulon response regulator PhoB